ncbi:MAG: PTS sugar transporter subunit IIB [Bacillota bacterium]
MRVLFACVLGASTSMIAKRVETAAQGRGLDMEIMVRAAHELSTVDLGSYDAVVLGPQVSYLRGPLQQQIGQAKSVLVIPPQKYGLGDGQQILDLILQGS